MSTYIQLEFNPVNSEESDLLVAKLSEVGFEGFEEDENCLKAFIESGKYKEHAVNEIIGQLNVDYTKSIIKETNWNKLWESNFQPVIVDDFVAIRADFHEKITGVEYDIVITPKMSFGTGHHATTFMMIQQMREIAFTGKTVLDFGTGTGILAILAEKLGASKIIAVDNDNWSIENAKENLQKNNCSKVLLKKTDLIEGRQQFDIILANINKNVIQDNLSSLVNHLSPGGILLISGLLNEDEADILNDTRKFSLPLMRKITNRDWICLKFSH